MKDSKQLETESCQDISATGDRAEAWVCLIQTHLQLTAICMINSSHFYFLHVRHECWKQIVQKFLNKDLFTDPAVEDTQSFSRAVLHDSHCFLCTNGFLWALTEAAISSLSVCLPHTHTHTHSHLSLTDAINLLCGFLLQHKWGSLRSSLWFWHCTTNSCKRGVNTSTRSPSDNSSVYRTATLQSSHPIYNYNWDALIFSRSPPLIHFCSVFTATWSNRITSCWYLTPQANRRTGSDIKQEETWSTQAVLTW